MPGAEVGQRTAMPMLRAMSASVPGRRALPVLLGLLGLLVLLRLPGLVIDVMDADEAYVAIQAQTVERGGDLYEDVADRKPPLVPYVYLAVFEATGSRDLRPVRAVADLSLAATGLLLVVEARRRRGDGAGLAAGLLFVLGSVTLFPGDAQAANYVHLALLPSTAAFVLTSRRPSPGPGRFAASGAALALAGLSKQTAAATLLPVLLHLRRSARPAVRLAAVLAGAGAVGLLAVLAWGLHDLWFWNVSGQGGFLSLGNDPLFVLWRFLGMTAGLLVLNAALTALVGVAWRGQQADDADLWLWLLSGFVAMVAGLRFWGHYYLHLLPPAVVLGAIGLERLAAGRRRLAVGGAAVAAVGCSVLAWWPETVHELPEYEPVAAYVRSHTAPDDPVWVWGFFPEAAWAADRPLAVRFVHAGFLTGFSGGRRAGDDSRDAKVPGADDMLWDDLAAHPPVVILDTSDAGIRSADQVRLDDQPRLWPWVVERYCLDTTIDDVDVLVQLDRVDDPASCKPLRP